MTSKSYLSKYQYEGVKQTYKDFSYDSKLEAGYAAMLDRMIKTGEIESWERQVKVELFGENGAHICDYKVDFLVYHKDGSKEYVEVKGLETPYWRLKWKLLEDKFGKQTEVKLKLVKAS